LHGLAPQLPYLPQLVRIVVFGIHQSKFITM
jgi:hypothetical protein